MISIRFKLVWIVIALVGAYFIVNEASAQQPTYSGQDLTAITLTMPPEYLGQSYNYCVFQNLISLGCSSVDEDFVGNNPQVQNFVTDWFAVNDNQLQLDIIIVSAGGFSSCDSGNTWIDCFNSGFYIDDNGIILPTPLPPSSNSTWGDSGFWGETITTDDVKTDMVASVQATGSNLWPMLIFLGIAVAFAIFGWLVTSINDSVKPKTGRRASKTFDPVSFNKKADELQEFYSKTGGADPALVEQIKKRNKQYGE